MIRLKLNNYSDRWWDTLLSEIKRERPISAHLEKYNAKLYIDEEYPALVGGVEFETEEDLLYFKLKFN